MALDCLSVCQQRLVWTLFPSALQFGGNEGGITQKSDNLFPYPRFHGCGRHPFAPTRPARLFPCGAAICPVAPVFGTRPHRQATDRTDYPTPQQIGAVLVSGIGGRVSWTPPLRA